MEIFQDISGVTITNLLLPYSLWNVDEPGSAESYLKKSDGTFVKLIIVGGIIGTTFITLVGAHWMILHKKPAIGLETFSLSCDTTTELTLKKK